MGFRPPQETWLSSCRANEEATSRSAIPPRHRAPGPTLARPGERRAKTQPILNVTPPLCRLMAGRRPTAPTIDDPTRPPPGSAPGGPTPVRWRCRHQPATLQAEIWTPLLLLECADGDLVEEQGACYPHSGHSQALSLCASFDRWRLNIAAVCFVFPWQETRESLGQKALILTDMDR